MRHEIFLMQCRNGIFVDEGEDLITSYTTLNPSVALLVLHAAKAAASSLSPDLIRVFRERGSCSAEEEVDW